MDGKIDEKDRISGLPDFVLHRILSFLGRKQANQTCVLSKRWNFIWDTFPIFVFDLSRFIKDPPWWAPEYMMQVPKFMNLVDKSLRKFTTKELLMERLYLSLPLLYRSYSTIVDEWVALSLDNGVRDLSLRVQTKYLENDSNYTLSETAFVAKSIKGLSKLYSLQKLSLEWVHMSEGVIQNIVHHCPNLNRLRLGYFSGLKSLRISKLHKLETVIINCARSMVDLERVSVDARNLKCFYFCGGDLHCSISLTSCHDLKELCLNSCNITEDLLHLHLSRFPLLEVLKIINCTMLRRVKISAQRLRRLQLSFGRTEIEMIQINAPTLSLFEYSCFNIPVLCLENIPCLTEIDYVLHNEDADTRWFSELRKFLGLLSRRKIFTLVVRKNKVNFDLEKLGEREIPPLVTTDHLTITTSNIIRGVDCAALIDGLLWSCYPKIISIIPDSKFNKDCIKVLSDKLSAREQPSCCGFSYIRCWRHHLKAAKIEGGTQNEQQSHLFPGSNGLSSLENIEEARFELEWNFESVISNSWI